MKEKYVLVTGASKGLGRAFAEEFAAKKNNLILIALENEGLDEIASFIKQKYQIDVRVFETNLADSEAVFRLATKINSEFEVQYLINNAGIGGTSIFSETEVCHIDNLIMINIRALSLLTRLLLLNLKRQEKAYILNIASMASFSPMTYKAVYSASKAYVYYFSRALSEELKDHNIVVSVVHPGPMRTNSDVIRRIERQGVLARIGGLISPEKTAKIAVRELERKVLFIVPGLMNKLNWIVMRLLPIKLQLFLGYKLSSREL